MKHLRKFNTLSDYNFATIYHPSVSLISSNMELIYDPIFIPDTVTIGGVKWATCNVGATRPEEYGLYFQWGDTQGYTAEQVGSGTGKKYFGWEDYKYGNGTSNPGENDMTKYNSTDGLTTLELSDDAAHATYGGNWRMPTSTELNTFSKNVIKTWTSDYEGTGVSGMICTDKTDSSKVLFFPAAGSINKGSLRYIGSRVSFWSSSINSSYKIHSYSLFTTIDDSYWTFSSDRYYGRTIRGVLDE